MALINGNLEGTDVGRYIYLLITYHTVVPHSQEDCEDDLRPLTSSDTLVVFISSHQRSQGGSFLPAQNWVTQQNVTAHTHTHTDMCAECFDHSCSSAAVVVQQYELQRL